MRIDIKMRIDSTKINEYEFDVAALPYDVYWLQPINNDVLPPNSITIAGCLYRALGSSINISHVYENDNLKPFIYRWTEIIGISQNIIDEVTLRCQEVTPSIMPVLGDEYILPDGTHINYNIFPLYIAAYWCGKIDKIEYILENLNNMHAMHSAFGYDYDDYNYDYYDDYSVMPNYDVGYARHDWAWANNFNIPKSDMNTYHYNNRPTNYIIEKAFAILRQSGFNFFHQIVKDTRYNLFSQQLEEKLNRLLYESDNTNNTMAALSKPVKKQLVQSAERTLYLL